MGPDKIFGRVTAVKVRLVRLTATSPPLSGWPAVDAVRVVVVVWIWCSTVVEGGSALVDVPVDTEDAVVDVVEETGQGEVWNSAGLSVVTAASKGGYRIHSPRSSSLHSPAPPPWSISIVVVMVASLCVSNAVGTVFELAACREVRVGGAGVVTNGRNRPGEMVGGNP